MDIIRVSFKLFIDLIYLLCDWNVLGSGICFGYLSNCFNLWHISFSDCLTNWMLLFITRKWNIFAIYANIHCKSNIWSWACYCLLLYKKQLNVFRYAYLCICTDDFNVLYTSWPLNAVMNKNNLDQMLVSGYYWKRSGFSFDMGLRMVGWSSLH